MTTEEKAKIEIRLAKAKSIESNIESLKEGLAVFDSGRIYLNACTFQREHEAMSRALQLVEPAIIEIFKQKIEELKKEWSEL